MNGKPLPVIPLEYQQPGTSAQRFNRRTLVLLIVAWSVCAGAWLAVVTYDVESVLVTGPVIAALGVTLSVVGLRAPRRSALLPVIGAAHLAICLLCFGLVQWLSWSPREALIPFGVLGGIHVAVTGVASAWLVLSRLRGQDPKSGRPMHSHLSAWE